MFQIITNGLDWDEALTPLMEHISPILALFYSLYVAFTIFAMLNVITGVFVESALRSDAEEKDINMVGRLLDFLRSAEADGEMTDASRITWEVFEKRLTDPLIRLYFKSVDLDPGEARGLFRLLDADQSGSVDAEEFVTGCL